MIEKSPIHWPAKSQQVRSKSLLQTLLLVLLVVALLAGYVYYGISHTPYSNDEQVSTEVEDTIITTLSDDEKLQRLESLQKNVNNLSEEEKYNRLNNL